MDDLRDKVSGDVACLMLTNPNTLGLFDENIAEIAATIHAAGGTLYYDGANLNAVMGHSRPGDMGFDIVHVNLHNVSFSQPHGWWRGRGRSSISRLGANRAIPCRCRKSCGARSSNGGGPYFDLDFSIGPKLDRPPAWFPGQLRRLRSGLRLHSEPRRRRSHRGIRDCRCSERQLPKGTAWPGGRWRASACRSPLSATACTSSSSPASR